MARQDSDSIAHRESIGYRLRSRRHELGLSLRDVAAQADVTASFLSHLERGLSDMSLGVLRRIAAVLGVPVMYFLTEDHAHSPVVRAEERPVIELHDPRVRYEMLVPDLARKMEALIGRIEPGSGNVVRPLRQHDEEFMFILSGALRIELGGREYVLSAGDSLSIGGRDIQVLACASDEQAVWLSVITPPVF